MRPFCRIVEAVKHLQPHSSFASVPGEALMLIRQVSNASGKSRSELVPDICILCRMSKASSMTVYESLQSHRWSGHLQETLTLSPGMRPPMCWGTSLTFKDLCQDVVRRTEVFCAAWNCFELLKACSNCQCRHMAR